MSPYWENFSEKECEEKLAELAKQKYGSPDDVLFIFAQLLKTAPEKEKAEIRSQLDAKYKKQQEKK